MVLSIYAVITYFIVAFIFTQKEEPITSGDIILWLLSPIVLPIGIVISIYQYFENKRNKRGAVIEAPEPLKNLWD